MEDLTGFLACPSHVACRDSSWDLNCQIPPSLPSFLTCLSNAYHAPFTLLGTGHNMWSVSKYTHIVPHFYCFLSVSIHSQFHLISTHAPLNFYATFCRAEWKNWFSFHFQCFTEAELKAAVQKLGELGWLALAGGPLRGSSGKGPREPSECFHSFLCRHCGNLPGLPDGERVWLRFYGLGEPVGRRFPSLK